MRWWRSGRQEFPWILLGLSVLLVRLLLWVRLDRCDLWLQSVLWLLSVQLRLAVL